MGCRKSKNSSTNFDAVMYAQIYCCADMTAEDREVLLEEIQNNPELSNEKLVLKYSQDFKKYHSRRKKEKIQREHKEALRRSKDFLSRLKKEHSSFSLPTPTLSAHSRNKRIEKVLRHVLECKN